LSYLTRFETVSNRFLPLSSFFAFTDSARTLPEELVNPASGLCISRCKLRGVAPTSLTRPFPSHLGLSLRRFANFFRLSPSISAPPGISQSSHALPRLLTPRHPPRALSSLAALTDPSLLRRRT
jgi:hypothetical protein